jgi:hypothetical protein
MILPTKRLGDRALFRRGCDVLRVLTEPKTGSRGWFELRKPHAPTPELAVLTYDWFVLALDLLFLINAVHLESGRLRRVRR